MSLRAPVLPALCLALFVTIGCGGEPPEKEMQQAQGALDAARAAGADKYATEEFNAAQTALAHAREAVTQRDYRLALDRALDSRERAQNAAKEAADGKATARTEADRALTAAQAQLDAADARLKAAEAGNVAARLLTGPRRTIDTARTSVQEARATFEKGDYLDIATKVNAATASLPAALEQIESASASSGRRRR
jgi:hypothetical protein